MSRHDLRSPTVMCGVPIDDLTLAETVVWIGGLVDRGRTTGRTHQVVTVNVDFLVNAMADAELLSVLQRADLAVADGMPVVWGSKLLGSPVRERVAGADLVPALGALAATSGYSLYLFGAAEGIASRAAELLVQRHPGLRVTGRSAPFFATAEEMDPAILDDIAAHDPDILCVALGHPKQEKWIDRYRDALRTPVLIGVGGSLDFLVGHRRRAPAWMQHSGTEWLYRALQEPGRLARRYTRDLARFGPRLAREVSLVRSQPASEGQPCLVEQSGTTTVLRVQGPLRLENPTVQSERPSWMSTPGHRVIVDMRNRSALDHREICELVGLAKRLADNGGELGLTSVGPQLAHMLLELGLYGFLPTASSPAPSAAALPPATGPTTPFPVISSPSSVGRKQPSNA